MLTPRETITVHVNQSDREGYVLAVIGSEALIEYEMPKGTTALRIVPIDDENAYPYKSISCWIVSLLHHETGLKC